MLLLPALLSFLIHAPHRFEHPATPTRIDVRELPAVLTEAHRDVFGFPPSRARLGMAIGQVRLEGLALPGRNLGGLEYVPGKAWVRVDRLTRLRAYDTYTDAAAAYWGILGARCRGALSAMDSGDPDETAIRLRRCGYFRAPVEWYARGLRALMVR